MSQNNPVNPAEVQQIRENILSEITEIKQKIKIIQQQSLRQLQNTIKAMYGSIPNSTAHNAWEAEVSNAWDAMNSAEENLESAEAILKSMGEIS